MSHKLTRQICRNQIHIKRIEMCIRDRYEAEASQISDRFEEVQQLIHVRDTMYTNLQAQADVAHTGKMCIRDRILGIFFKERTEC